MGQSEGRNYGGRIATRGEGGQVPKIWSLEKTSGQSHTINNRGRETRQGPKRAKKNAMDRQHRSVDGRWIVGGARSTVTKRERIGRRRPTA